MVRYSLGDSEIGAAERWFWGVTLFENPNATIPLPPACLPSTSTFRVRQGRLVRELLGFHSMTSWTQMIVPEAWLTTDSTNSRP